MSMQIKNNTESGTNDESTRPKLFARQPASTLWKITFWASVVGTLGSLGGAIAITIGSGAPSQDIVITTVCWLITAGILATRLRWAPLVTTVLGAFNLYLICTQPYVIESLANPKGPNGGYGHFVGDVVVMALAILVLGGSITLAVQNYRQGSMQTPRWLPPGLSLVAGMAIGALFIGALAQPVQNSGTTYTNGVPTVHMGANTFLQSSVTIPKGSKLLLVDDVASLHVLANGSWQNNVARSASEPGAPIVNNVQVNGNSVEIGPFATAGTYHIFCEVHVGMNLTVIVQ